MIELSPTVLVWVGSLLVAFVGSIGSICAHMLIRMDRTLTSMALADGKYKTATEARLATLERHDARGAQESVALLRYLERNNGDLSNEQG